MTIDIMQYVKWNRSLLKCDNGHDERAIVLEEKFVKYYLELQKQYATQRFLDGGYYHIHNHNVCECERENAEFRMLELIDSQEQCYLFRTPQENWDMEYGNMQVEILGKVKRKV